MVLRYAGDKKRSIISMRELRLEATCTTSEVAMLVPQLQTRVMLQKNQPGKGGCLRLQINEKSPVDQPSALLQLH